MKNISKLILLAIISITVLLQSCSKEEQETTKSMEQIHNETGVPVTYLNITKSNMDKGLTFYSKLFGWKESSKGAAFRDKIVKINAKIGDYVKKGDIIVEFPKDNLSLQYSQALAALETVEKTKNRAKRLLEIGEMSQQKFDEIELQFKISKRNIAQMEQAMVAEAPIDGVIVSMDYRVGDVPQKETALFKVAKLDKMIAKINVSDTEIDLIKMGQEAICVWHNKEFRGKVTQISEAISPYTQAFPVEITFNNPKRALKSGITVDVKLLTYKNSDAIVIPRKCIREINGEAFVYIINNDIAKLTKVILGNETGLNIEISEGLNVSDKVINCCFNLLEDGKKINIIND